MSKNTAAAGVVKHGTGSQKTSYGAHCSPKPANGVTGQSGSSQNKPSHASPRHGVTGQKGASGGGKGPAGRLPRA